MITYKGKRYTTKHGSPFDRGSADSYYDRPRYPHRRDGQQNEHYDLTPDQIDAYNAGYDWNEESGIKKY